MTSAQPAPVRNSPSEKLPITCRPLGRSGEVQEVLQNFETKKGTSYITGAVKDTGRRKRSITYSQE